MKTETTLIVGALAIAAGLVLIPKRPRSASGVAAPQAPRVGSGDAGTIWNDATTAQYREALRRETGGMDWAGV